MLLSDTYLMNRSTTAGTSKVSRITCMTFNELYRINCFGCRLTLNTKVVWQKKFRMVERMLPTMNPHRYHFGFDKKGNEQALVTHTDGTLTNNDLIIRISSSLRINGIRSDKPAA